VIATILRRTGEASTTSTSARMPASSSSATEVWGKSATPKPCSTIFFAASMLSSSIRLAGDTPAVTKSALVRSW